jgi:hypothetical protein
VGAAASLAAAYLRQRDRVGLVSFGGFVQWLQPGSGQAALYRLLDTLMETQVFATAAWKGIRHLPPRTLPAKALIVALTPLVDERGVAALFDLLARGYDLAVVDISPLPGRPGRPPASGTSWPSGCGPWSARRCATATSAWARPWSSGRRAAPAAGAPGGGGMPAPRRARTRLACGLAATAVAAGLALAPLAAVTGPLRQAWPGWPASACSWPPRPPCGWARCSARPWSCSLAEYTVVLVRRGDRIDAAAPLVGAGLLLYAELASWAREASPRVRDERPVLVARAAVVAASALAAVGWGAGPAGRRPAGRGGLARLAIGVVAATGTLALVAVVARPTSTRAPRG